MIATTHPYANSDGSSDLSHPDNTVSLFNLVNQVILRSLPDQPLLVINSRAFAHNPEQGFIDADILVAFKRGYVKPENLNTLEVQLIDSLTEDRLKVRLLDGSQATSGYEVGTSTQAAYLNATKNKTFALLWVSPEARANYRQQNENLWQAAQFNTLGIETIHQDLLGHVQKQHFGSLNEPQHWQTQLATYNKTQNILHLQAISLQAEQKAYSLVRLIDINSRQAFLLIYDDQQKLIALANLFPRSQQISSLIPQQLASQLTAFVNRRDFWLQLGEQ